MEKKLNTLRKGKELSTGRGKTVHQERLVTEHYAEIIGLSKGHCYKALQTTSISFKNLEGRKSRFRSLRSSHRCSNTDAKF